MNDISNHKVSTIKNDGYLTKKYSDSEIKNIIDTSEVETTNEKVQKVNKEVQNMAMSLSYKRLRKLAKILPMKQVDKLKLARQEGSTPILESNTPTLEKKPTSHECE